MAGRGRLTEELLFSSDVAPHHARSAWPTPADSSISPRRNLRKGLCRKLAVPLMPLAGQAHGAVAAIGPRQARSSSNGGRLNSDGAGHRSDNEADIGRDRWEFSAPRAGFNPTQAAQPDGSRNRAADCRDEMQRHVNNAAPAAAAPGTGAPGF